MVTTDIMAITDMDITDITATMLLNIMEKEDQIAIKQEQLIILLHQEDQTQMQLRRQPVDLQFQLQNQAL